MFNFFKKQSELHTTAIIMAAGSGSRMNMTQSKQLIHLAGKPLIAHTLLAFEQTEGIDRIVIVTREEDILLMSDIVSAYEVTKVGSILKGGRTRQESVSLGLAEVGDTDLIAIHDGARPCITPYQIMQTLEAAKEHGAAAIGCKVCDTLKMVEKGKIIKTMDRENLWQIQTPQIFQKELILYAHLEAEKRGIAATDDTALLEAFEIPVYMVEGSSANIKVTTQTDLAIAESFLGGIE